MSLLTRDTAFPANQPLGFILRAVRQHALSHLVVLVSVVLAVACSIGSQYSIKHLVDTLTAGVHAPVWWAFGALATLIAADNMLWRVGGWVASRCFVAVTGDLRRDLFHHLTGHSPAYFADRPPGTLAARITATGNAVYTVENTLAWNVLPPLLAVAGSIGVMLTVSWQMAAVLMTISAGLALLLSHLAAKGRSLHHQYATDAAAVDGEMVDVINNMPLVRAFGATVRERQRFGASVEREMQTRSRSLRYLEKLRLFHAATTACLTAGLLAWSILLWEQGAASSGDVVLVTSLGFTILHGTRDLAVGLVDTTQHIARVSEALATLLLPHDLCDAAAATALPAARGGVEFRDVSYSYPASTQAVLDHFNLVVEAGTRVGLVGRSGSGKSTVLALLQRLRDVPSGRVLVDGHDVAGLTQDSLHDAIGVVPQDVLLFHRSVLDNIRYGRPGASDAEVRAAADAACCREFIDALPDGYDTPVGDRGSKLSGGQRQRLAIARAFLRNAPILLLDEATSALDSESEASVERALEGLMQGRTVIAVAHRLSTLKHFDRIVVMQAGRVLQDGTPAELERSNGPFRNSLMQLETMVGVVED